MKARSIATGVRKVGSVRHVAEILGVSRSTIYRWRRGQTRPSEPHEARLRATFRAAGYTPPKEVIDRRVDKPATHEALYRSATGRIPVSAVDGRYRNLQRFIRDAGGTKQAAELLGRTESTIKAWVGRKDKRRAPNAESLRRIADATPAVRQRAVAKRARGRIAQLQTQSNAVMTLRVDGNGGPRGPKKHYVRNRTATGQITGDALAAYYDALARGHTDKALKILNDEISRTYVDGWEWSSVDHVDIRGAEYSTTGYSDF